MILKIKVIVLAILFIGGINKYCLSQVKMNFDFDTPYGNNDTVGKSIKINGTSIYYEVYGRGTPLLLIHGNSANIKSMGNQIDYFKDKYMVITADSRGHGKSELNTTYLSYNQIAEDMNQLVKVLNLDSVSIVGWSDGGTIALLMGIQKRCKIHKIAAMGANLRADTIAIYNWAFNKYRKREQHALEMLENGDTTQNWLLVHQRTRMIMNQTLISHQDLNKIECPTLIIAGDQDIIREEHSVEIFQNIPNAHLCIMPGETHFTPASNPKLFNHIVNNFLDKDFIRPNSDLSNY